MSTGENFIFTLGPIFIGIVFVLVLSTFVFVIGKSIAQWRADNNASRQELTAKVVAKRTGVHGGGQSRAYSEYFVTFEQENGSRTELEVKGPEYGMLAEGDRGVLTFQGTRYLGFKRN